MFFLILLCLAVPSQCLVFSFYCNATIKVCGIYPNNPDGADNLDNFLNPSTVTVGSHADGMTGYTLLMSPFVDTGCNMSECWQLHTEPPSPIPETQVWTIPGPMYVDFANITIRSAYVGYPVFLEFNAQTALTDGEDTPQFAAFVITQPETTIRDFTLSITDDAAGSYIEQRQSTILTPADMSAILIWGPNAQNTHLLNIHTINYLTGVLCVVGSHDAGAALEMDKSSLQNISSTNHLVQSFYNNLAALRLFFVNANPIQVANIVPNIRTLGNNLTVQGQTYINDSHAIPAYITEQGSLTYKVVHINTNDNQLVLILIGLVVVLVIISLVVLGIRCHASLYAGNPHTSDVVEHGTAHVLRHTLLPEHNLHKRKIAP